MARGGAIGLLILWSWLLIRDHWQALAARIALAFNLAIICHIISSAQYALNHRSLLGGLLDVGSSSVIGLFWLFTRVWFDDCKRIGWWSVGAVAIPPMFVALMHPFALDRLHTLDTIWFPMLRVIWFSFTISALWIAWRGRDNDLIEARRRLRLQLVVATGVLALLVNFVEIAVFRFGAAQSWRSMPEFAIFIVVLLLSSTMFQHRQADQFGPVKRKDDVDSAARPVDDPLVARLLTHMSADLPHRDETLTIAGLAAQLGEQEYRLRRAINGQLGYRNFATFLNGYRLAEVKQALADQGQKEVPILTIALDAGFGSLGPFNRAFREAEAMTPSEYRGRRLVDSGIG